MGIRNDDAWKCSGKHEIAFLESKFFRRIHPSPPHQSQGHHVPEIRMNLEQMPCYQFVIERIAYRHEETALCHNFVHIQQTTAVVDSHGIAPPYTPSTLIQVN